ncbi:hypothetical protein AQ1689_110098 [Tenacibaculum maritimum]|nr:hypothetical protein AQ1689_110098 [Tenacibaculum maritimum]CAA0205351.1 hypothetical protein AQ1688_90048 [Tenacibaculum maritimum]
MANMGGLILYISFIFTDKNKKTYTYYNRVLGCFKKLKNDNIRYR